MARNSGTMKGGKPNILWYCTDQQRYDTIHELGNPEINTPFLDNFVGNGFAFTNAYTQCPICTPARASFLTGRYPASHHVHRNGNEQFPSHEVLVTRLLSDAGYHCGLVGKLHLAGAQGTGEPRTNDGYEVYHWSHHPYPDLENNEYITWLREEKKVDPVQLYASLAGTYGPGVATELHQTTWCTEKAIDFIQHAPSDRPWLLSVNPFSPHPPLFPPEDYLRRYKSSELSLPLFRSSDMERQMLFRTIDQQTVDPVDPTAEYREQEGSDLPLEFRASLPPLQYDAREIRACYYGEIELIDHQFGRLISVLEQTGQLEETLVIFMSDHGEMLGDHGLLYKGCRFFEGLVHVPLIMSLPGTILDNQKSDALVELIDIAPTLLELAGVDTPHNMQGKSLLPILRGEQDPNVHKSFVISEYNDAMSKNTVGLGPSNYHASHGSMYFDGRYKLIVYQGHENGELFDLEADPGEFENQWNNPEHSQLKCRLLHKHFDAFLASSDAGVNRVKDY